MKGFFNFILFMYLLNFVIGYIAVRNSKDTVSVACEKILGEATKGAPGFLLVFAGLPGEANACLDLGHWPKKK